ncbi:ATP-binding protein [Mucilaginibacter achroorhodeus]|uniref:ATP-binding protein n=1 Tax=Mucilaginibacter achroorhodeus TaxID=2599294 RepID=A0A563TYH2_9SPHI|nr:ATP-binding protein [Mucilaginibacter achroorhodeus]
MPLELDSKRIAQLFSNLLSNALTHGQADETVNVKASIVDGQFRLQVSNSGTPIPEASLASLFLPFSRGREMVRKVWAWAFIFLLKSPKRMAAASK